MHHNPERCLMNPVFLSQGDDPVWIGRFVRRFYGHHSLSEFLWAMTWDFDLIQAALPDKSRG